jgi:hypothetical protein
MSNSVFELCQLGSYILKFTPFTILFNYEVSESLKICIQRRTKILFNGEMKF